MNENSGSHPRADETLEVLLEQLAEKKQEASAAYLQLLERIEQAETHEQMAVLLDEWLHESHHAVIDPEIRGLMYWERFEEWFKTEEHKALEAAIEGDASDPVSRFDICQDDDDFDFDFDAYLDALFDKAVSLQCWELLASYLRQQIQWVRDIKQGDALYAEELPYGNYAAEALLRHDITKYGALYVEFLSTCQDAVPEETVGEFLREIIPELGITSATYPIILARLTFASDQHGWDDFGDWCEALPIRDWLYENNQMDAFLAAYQAYVERDQSDPDEIQEQLAEIRDVLAIEDAVQKELLNEHDQAQRLQQCYVQREACYQQELSRISGIDTPEAMGAELVRWLEEVRHPDAMVSEDPVRFDYEHRFDQRFMGREIRELVRAMDEDLLEQLNLKKPKIYCSALLYSLFEQAKTLQAWDALENYLKAQIDWLKLHEIQAFYLDELPYGHYAAGLLAEAHPRYIPLYVEYLKALPLITEYEGTGEQIDQLFHHYWDNQDQIEGGFAAFLPVLKTRLTFARGDLWEESFCDWCETALRRWLDDHPAHVKTLGEQIQAELADLDYDEEDIENTVHLLMNAD
ncbi:hypothetical protein KDD30_10840 [Photobacterium sp. GJ3]|uniref:hypothetical protein n=1 Tax=Photobacterium sp. GJ3 TaxID=2829502 RepID=UPI001B8BEC2D|nr:hypothetical protein [Photobacterium sp. GJ3]QUJ66654.1 hypothetical protein KDD30_10840 [Photobacterium sp. GJ3]